MTEIDGRKIITIQEILETGKKEDYTDYKLFDFESIPETVINYNRVKQGNWYETGSTMKPNPEYVQDEKEFYACFIKTPDLGLVCGDDLFDYGYSGTVYSYYIGPDGKEVKTTIIRVPFSLPGKWSDEDKTKIYDVDVSFWNDDDNDNRGRTIDVLLGKEALLYVTNRKNFMSYPKAVSVMAGINPYGFIISLSDINNLL